MRPKTTLFLLAVTIGLIVFIAFFEPPTTPEAIENDSRVIRVDADSVSRIEITNTHGKARLQRKKDGTWFIESPIQDRLDPKLMEKIMKEAGNLLIYETMSPKEIGEEDFTPDSLGFGDKKITLRFFEADTEVASVEIGDSVPMQDMAYMRRPGDWEEEPVHAAWGLIKELVESPFDEMRDPNLLAGSAEEVRRVKFSGKTGSIQVEWDLEKERWMMRKPIQTRAGKEAIDEKLAALLTTEINGFLNGNDPGASEAFQESSKEIRVWFHKKEGGTDVSLAEAPAVEGDEFYYAKVSDRKGIFRLPKSILNAYTVNPNDLRDRRLGDFNEKTISRIVIEENWRDGAAARPIKLTNREGTWTIERNGREEKADSVKISNMIKAVSEEKIINFTADAAVDLTPYGLDKPIHEISFITDVIIVPDDPDSDTPPRREERTRKLQISHSPEGTKIFAKYENEPFIYEIDFPLYDLFNTNQPVNWKSPELLAFPMVALKGISVERNPNPPVNLIYEVQTNTWGAESGGKDLTPRLNVRRAREMLKTVSNLHATKWTADRAVANRMITTEPILTVLLDIERLDEKRTERVKLVFAPTPAGMKAPHFYGRINESPDFFYIDREVFSTLYAPLLNEEKPDPDTAPAAEQVQN